MCDNRLEVADIFIRHTDQYCKNHSLSLTEFIRRFLLHVLPDGFVKIRYFGFLAHRNKRHSVDLIRQLINPGEKPVQKRQETAVEMMLRITGIDITCCPQCGHNKLVAKPLVPVAAAVA